MRRPCGGSHVTSLWVYACTVAVALCVVIAESRSVVRQHNAQIHHLIDVAMSGHGSTTILVYRQLIRLYTVACCRFIHQLSCQRGILFGGDHPRQHIAAAQVDHGIQRQVP